MSKTLKKIFFENFLIKFFSLVFAVALWLHVVARGTSEVNFVVPLELRDIPQNLMVVGQVPGYVDVRLQGQEGLVKRLSVRDITAFVSLAGAKSGELAFNLSPSNVTVPGTIKVAGISPAEVKLRLEKTLRRELAVKAEVTGRPAPGYRVESVDIFPRTVTAQGPESSLRKITEALTASASVDGAAGSFDKLVRVEPPAEYGVKLDESSVRITVTLSKTRKQSRGQ